MSRKMGVRRGVKAQKRLESKLYVYVLNWERQMGTCPGARGGAVEGLENRLYWPYGTQ